MADNRRDVVHAFRGLGFFVVDGKVVLDGLLEFPGASVAPPPDLLVRDLCKPAFDLIEPGCAGRGEVEVVARVSEKPLVDHRGLVGARTRWTSSSLGTAFSMTARNFLNSMDRWRG